MINETYGKERSETIFTWAWKGIENIIETLLASFWNVLNSPVDLKRK